METETTAQNRISPSACSPRDAVMWSILQCSTYLRRDCGCRRIERGMKHGLNRRRNFYDFHSVMRSAHTSQQSGGQQTSHRQPTLFGRKMHGRPADVSFWWNNAVGKIRKKDWRSRSKQFQLLLFFLFLLPKGFLPFHYHPPPAFYFSISRGGSGAELEKSIASLVCCWDRAAPNWKWYSLGWRRERRTCRTPESPQLIQLTMISACFVPTCPIVTLASGLNDGRDVFPVC